LFISVDPQRDTLAHLQTYVQFFDPAIRGVTGSVEEIAEISRRYGVFYQKQGAEMAGEGYVVDHSSDTFIVGQDGRLKARMAHGIPPEQVAALIRQFLNQT
jgi:protein SCO1/2